jgi:hypothetical protein
MDFHKNPSNSKFDVILAETNGIFRQLPFQKIPSVFPRNHSIRREMQPSGKLSVSGKCFMCGTRNRAGVRVRGGEQFH